MIEQIMAGTRYPMPSFHGEMVNKRRNDGLTGGRTDGVGDGGAQSRSSGLGGWKTWIEDSLSEPCSEL